MKWLRFGFKMLFLLVTMVPFLWLILASFKTNQELFAAPFSLPKGG